MCVRVRSPDIAGQVVALAMVAVLLGVVAGVQVVHLRRAHQHMGLARRGIHIHQFAAIEIRQMLSVGRPGELAGRLADQRPMGKDGIDSERLFRRLRIDGMCGQRERCNSRKQDGGFSCQRASPKHDLRSANPARNAGTETRDLDRRDRRWASGSGRISLNQSDWR